MSNLYYPMLFPYSLSLKSKVEEILEAEESGEYESFSPKFVCVGEPFNLKSKFAFKFNCEEDMVIYYLKYLKANPKSTYYHEFNT